MNHAMWLAAAIILAVPVMALADAEDFNFQGLRFGMTEAEVVEKTGWQLRDDPKAEDGYHYATRLAPETGFKGVDFIRLGFYRGALCRIQIEYEPFDQDIEEAAFRKALSDRYEVLKPYVPFSEGGLEVQLEERKAPLRRTLSLRFTDEECHSAYLNEIVESMGRPF